MNEVFDRVLFYGECLGFDLKSDFSVREYALYNNFNENFKFDDSSLLVGDNLSHLMKLASSFREMVDLCYIDPPYNTGSKFLYNDTRKGECDGFFGVHNAWMRFMLPRLAVAKEIMKRDGVIAISIDDNEFAYLKILMDTVFGGSNFIGTVVVCRSKNGKGSNKNIAPTHEYLLVYGKTDESKLYGQLDDSSVYDKTDIHGAFKVDGLFRKKGEASLRTDRPNMYYPLYSNPNTGEVSVDASPGLVEVFPVDSKGIERRWLWSKETARLRSWQLYSSKNNVIYVKNYSSEGKRIKIRTFWDSADFYTEKATNEIIKIFGKKIFDTPKPLKFIKAIIESMAKPDAIILDFFAGSGTTAHAAALLNTIDNGSRKTILIENNTKIPDSHIAYKNGFNLISDITKERLRKIHEHNERFKYRIYTLD
ncbi:MULTISPECIES: site-specific DNA-methyltransferase [Pectobacterium]|uniref:site-specific DNA-methyltransferase n=1 Tax=Pectobacterium TaxID=122277 RepID=UPI001F082030|nr:MULTISPECIES: site-specific DNA-methyltransferase [Pectobacterium]